MDNIRSVKSRVSGPWIKLIPGGLGIGMLGLLFYFISPFWSSTGKP